VNLRPASQRVAQWLGRSALEGTGKTTGRQSRCQQRCWHPAHRGMIESGLGQGQATMFLDSGKPLRAIGARAGQNDTDGVLALVLRQRREERIDLPAMVARRSGLF
jgi:hypothetical protein